VKQTVEWKSPARHDQVLELSFETRRLGTTSFTIGAEFRVAGDPRVLATVETVYVLMDGRTLTKLPIPPDIRTALEHGAPGRTTDHAAYARA
jgi:acyl-CoA thioester hydrolase